MLGLSIFKNKVQYPDKEWLASADWKTQFGENTPDLALLQEFEYQLLFVYDEMMDGHNNNAILKEGGTVHLPWKVFTQDRFQLFKKNLGTRSYPIALDSAFSTVAKARIKGELYAVRPAHYLQLDFHKQNRVQFLRKRIKLVVPYRKIITSTVNPEQGAISDKEMVRLVTAFAYIGKAEYWDSQIDNGFLFSPVRRFTPTRNWLSQYYYFTNLEYAKSHIF